MNWYSFAGAVCLLIFLVGCGLIVLWTVMNMLIHDRQIKDIENFITKEVKRIIVDTTSECMDILPEKILEAKKTIEGDQ